MKTKAHCCTLLRWFTVLLCGALASLAGGATLSVTPSSTSNTYTGVITLQIGGLTNTEPVIVQEYFDANTNGVVDPGELLIDLFPIRDGGVSIIGGHTNLSVPFDSNAATGAITTALNFASPLTFANTVGQHLYKVISPTGRFTPVTATLLVTNPPTGQTLSGTVYSNGVAPLPFATVAVVTSSGGYLGATLADSNGRYLINVNPGTNLLIAVAPGYFTDQSIAPQVTLTNGQSATNNIYLTNGTVTISGNVYEAGSSNLIGGTALQFESGNLFAIAFTDTNGNYSAAVAPSFWKIKPIKERLPRRAHLNSQATFQVNTTAASVTNANLAYYRGNALFYGRITDQLGVPLTNIELEGSDLANTYSSKSFSDPNGYYAVAVLGDTNLLSTTNQWSSDPNSSANQGLGGYVVNQFYSVNIVSNQAIQQNYVALPITAHISGHVQDNLGNPVGDVTLYASALNGYQSLNVRTDNSGNYSIGVATGSWQVNFSFGGNHDLASQGLVDLYVPYGVNIPPTNATLNITVYSSGTPLIGSPARTGPGQFSFNVQGSIGANYTLQTSTNLSLTNWSSLFSFQLTSNPFPITDSSATNGQRFYRLLKN